MSLPGCRIILRNGRLTGASRVDLTNSMDFVRKVGGNPTIVVHFHGGLVGEADAKAAAAHLAPEYASTGAVPVFVIWQTQLFETLRNNWKEAFSKDFFESLLERVLQFLVGRLEQPPGSKGPLQLPNLSEIRTEVAKREIGLEPYGCFDPEPSKMIPDLTPAEELQIKQTVLQDRSLAASAHEIIQNADVDQFEPQFGNEVLASRKEVAEGGRGLVATFALGVAVKAIMGALRRFNRGRGHGLYPTAVEEIAKAMFAAKVFGQFTWNSMKKDAKDAFGNGDDLFGGSALLRELELMWDQGLRPRVVLVGHSAGAIFVCEMLKASAKRRMPVDLKFDVVLLAPACTFRLLDDTLTLAPDRIATFRSLAMSDDLEQKDRMLGNLYPRSLLYFVSGVLEDAADEPLLGMQRFHTRVSPFTADEFPGIKRVLDAFESHQNAWIWSMSSAGAGLDCSSVSHGGFESEKSTLESVKHIIQHGT
jgi:hypothetical protein